MATTEDIDKAISELRAAKQPNIAAAARKYGIERTRLNRLFKGSQAIRKNYIAAKHLLSPQQDRRLMELLNRLTKDGIPPTPKLVRQLARDLCGKLPSKNWPSNWLAGHSSEFSSGNLRGFDLDRKKADSYWQYNAYFQLVRNPLSRRLALTVKAKGEACKIPYPTQRHIQYG
jgi:hypothetical protein